tara:strand:- start:228 stop:2051 length:1824 start_codon:yes stop_codon:yes gene_type:complete
MFLALLPFLALELALVILDVANPSLADDPLSGFSQSGRLFELDQRDEVYRTATARGLFFGDQEFAAEKPEDGFRVFCLGGSTVRGRPFTTESSFTRWLDLELADRSEGRTIEAVNCGGLSYASYRLRPIVAEVLRYRPDLIVVATGHNEFLEDRSYRGLKDRNAAVAWLEDRAMSLRTVTWCRRWLQSDEPEKQSEGPEEVQARLDEQRGFASYFRDAAWQDEVVSQYVESLKAMIAACRRAEVPLVLVRLGSNLRDCPPFKSEHRDGITPAELSIWQAAMDAGVAATDERRFDQALMAFREAEEIDDQFALVAWRIARTLDRLGRPEEAATAYRRARDLDVCPLRMITRLDKSLQRVASQSGTPLVDAAGAIEADSDDGLPGSDWYVDHVHPTLRGHQRIAELLVEEIGRGGWLELSAAATAARVRLNRRRHFRRLGPVFFSNGSRRVEWLENWARRQRLDAEVQPVSWIEFARAGNRAMDFGQWEDAWKAYAQALAACPEVAPAAVTVLRHACWLFEQGRSGDAADLVDRLRELPEAEQGAVAPIWSRAALVLAVESGDRDQAERTLARYSRLIKATASSPDTTGWARVMPDVLDRARRLVGNDP